MKINGLNKKQKHQFEGENEKWSKDFKIDKNYVLHMFYNLIKEKNKRLKNR